MKKWVIAFAAVLGTAAQANTVSLETVSSAVKAAQAVMAVANVINWQVGDYHKINVEMKFGKIGDGRKEAFKDEPAQNAVWYKQDMNLMGQKQVVESLISRTDGKELKRIVNGKEEPVGGDDSKVEIIEQSETEVTVPAGKFACIYIKAKVTSQGQTQEVEFWANPMDVNLDGMLKATIQSQLGPISLILQEFGPHR